MCENSTALLKREHFSLSLSLSLMLWFCIHCRAVFGEMKTASNRVSANTTGNGIVCAWSPIYKFWKAIRDCFVHLFKFARNSWFSLAIKSKKSVHNEPKEWVERFSKQNDRKKVVNRNEVAVSTVQRWRKKRLAKRKMLCCLGGMCCWRWAKRSKVCKRA